MEYVNRLFFRKDTGALIYRYSMKGDITVSTIEQDFEVFKVLSDYKIDAVAVIEVKQEDIEIQQNIEKAETIRLNTETMQVEFIMPSVDDEAAALEAQIAELNAKLSSLKG